VWTIDFKGKWHDTRAERCEPLTVRDEYSRYILASQRLDNVRTETVWSLAKPESDDRKPERSVAGPAEKNAKGRCASNIQNRKS
jgi:hypothetical protein